MEFCACIDTLYTELPWIKRFSAAKKDGFHAIEFWNWKHRNLNETKKAAEDANIAISGFNGDFEYSLIDPSHKERYLDYLKRSVEAAKIIGAESLTIHSNALDEKGHVVNYYNDLSLTVKLCSLYSMLVECVKIADENNIKMYLEPLNIRIDHVGNFLASTQMAAEITELIGNPQLKILYDVYHMQINEGDISSNLAKYKNQIGHIHIADVPGRHEPGTGELNYGHIISCLKEVGYIGRIGFELMPQTNTKLAVEAIMKLKTFI